MIIPYKVYKTTRKIIHAMILPHFEYTACGHYINGKNWKLDIEQFIESEECCKKCYKVLDKAGLI